jgi:predicted dehydrogenase/threonine dehydrogenase-like Zn-dependent dehydrogenase
MKQVFVKGGSVIVEKVPMPIVEKRCILVQVRQSCVSVGTEIASVKMSGLPLYKRALKQPDNVRKVLDSIKDQGIKTTADRVMGKLTSGSPTGYSASGVVIQVGSQVEGFCVGDRVACAGAGIANHAEVINVPVNLAVKIPDGLSDRLASTVTLGSIALQGVRRCEPTLGETVVVVGLGLLGQLTAQMLKANGCRVIGVDTNPVRVQLAKDVGIDFGLDPLAEDYTLQVLRLTDGLGADASIITAASSSNSIVSQAFSSCRKKGRVVLVGDVGLALNRSDFYIKELDFRISTSYGPGRYDPMYEEGGQDYPIGYVRWTENRNMEAYLSLLASEKINLEPFCGDDYSVDDANIAYDALVDGSHSKLVVTLKYSEEKINNTRVIRNPAAQKPRSGVIRVGLAGAGCFAQGMHLPNFLKLKKNFQLRSVMSRTGSNAKAVATQYQADFSTTEYEELLSDPDLDLILIATRHDLHAGMALRALQAGKHVLLEKPLAINEVDLKEIENFYLEASGSTPILLTGFNRRFSPALVEARRVLEKRSTPVIINYRMNAGFLPSEHWVHGVEGGGRNIGEACHIYDVFQYLTGSRPSKIEAISSTSVGKQWKNNDNFTALISYKDGSICSLTYTAMGHRNFPKEQMEVFFDGKVIQLNDYKNLKVEGISGGWESKVVQKGQYEELVALATGLNKGEWPISLQDQLDVSRLSFDIEAKLKL